MNRYIPPAIWAFAAWAGLWFGVPTQPNEVGGAGQYVSAAASAKK